ncbi:response regulator [Chloroflexia bacterium SDU3-3]|nr:response regulator [Chloroflexia bacterium SDU3-3]
MATILVVDDHSPNQRLLSFILEQNHFSVVTALNGVQALERLEESPVDLVVTDLSMPKMDGLTLMKHVRTDERYKQLPIVVLTASGYERDLVRASNSGANACLTKPIDSQELVSLVSQLVAQNQGPTTNS